MFGVGPVRTIMQKRTLIAPKRVKYKKAMKGSLALTPGFFTVNSGGSLAGSVPRLGEFAVKALSCARLEDKQLDNARTAIRRMIKADKGSKNYLRTFPDLPVHSPPHPRSLP